MLCGVISVRVAVSWIILFETSDEEKSKQINQEEKIYANRKNVSSNSGKLL